jgi:type II secretory pathway component GspD/PulD (secretin)
LGRQNGNLGFGGFVFSAQSDAVSVLLRALAARRTLHVLSRPQVRTTHNNLARVNVGQSVPLVNGVTVSQLGQANPQIVRQDTGITLEVTPRITPDGMVAMDVFASKSGLAGTDVPVFVNSDGSTITSPIINQSIADTIVNVPNGQTIVIGGMITKSDSSLERKVPWLGDLPVVGRAFRYDSTTVSRTELLIFLTPRIVLSDLDSELIKQVESERLHFIESEAEEIHGPLYSVPQTSSELLPHELYPDLQPEPMTPAIPNAVENP